ncbi:MAG: hypothetical protein J7M21_00615, partial [Planctomycetes bacterium]|nr:hypothetical protein [Planctomycetota bacterium]
PISAMLSGVLIKASGVYAMARVVFNVFGPNVQIAWILMVLGVLSMVLGMLLALGQWDLKRLLAYSSISQAGYIVLALGAAAGVLAVSDTGIGISPDARARLFEEFYRSPEAKRHFPDGTGLGLAICRQIVNLHGGTIGADAGPSGGSVFTVELPAAPGPHVAVEAGPAAAMPLRPGRDEDALGRETYDAPPRDSIL